MPEQPGALLLLAALILISAVLYSSVGHGGASAYLAAMTLFGVAAEVTKPAALVMNLGVAGVGTARFATAGLVPWKLLVPFLAGSVPTAFLGGLVKLPTHVHRIVLGVVLLFAAVRLALPNLRGELQTPPAVPVLAAIGAVFGFVAGLTGVGGGIFLSPLLILARWEEPRATAGASAMFILANSAAGLAGHVLAGRAIPAIALPLAAIALIGGLYGSWLGAKKLLPLTLRRLLAVVLIVAGGKLLLAR